MARASAPSAAPRRPRGGALGRRSGARGAADAAAPGLLRGGGPDAAAPCNGQIDIQICRQADG